MSAYLGVHTNEAVALGWTLLHFCWQSAVIALLYALVDRCTRRASAAVRYGIALVALTLMPLVAIATFVEQEWLIVPVSRTVTQTEEPQPVVIASRFGEMHAVVLEKLPTAAPVVNGGALWIAEHSALLLPCMDGVWLLGVVVLAVRAAGGWWQLRGLKLRARAVVPAEIGVAFERLRHRYRLGRNVLLRVSDEVVSPMVFGVWRTVVLMPLSAVAQLSPEQMEAVLAHELAHVRRWDYLFNLMQTMTECLFFFHPAVWWISHRVREFREVCCDEAAAQTCVEPAIYATALLQMEEQRMHSPRLAMALNGSGGTLLQRVRRVMGEKAMEQRQMSGIKMMTAGLALVGLYAVPHVAHSMKMEVPKASVAPVAEVAPHVAAQPRPQASVAVAPKVAMAAVPAVDVDETVVPMAAPMPNPAPSPNALGGDDSQEVKQSGMQYLDAMKAAGYPLDLNHDLDEIIRLRSLGVTPEYAGAMAQAGMGKPTLKELTSLKAVGVTPEYVKSLKSSSSAPTTFHDVIAFKSLGVTPEYAKQVESLGLGTPTMHDLTSMKAVGVTPEYVAGLKSAGFTPKDLHELVTMRAVGVTPEYASAMAQAGFPSASTHDLVSMKAQGMTPEYAKWLKANFPNADTHAMRQAITFHIDDKFVADAKAHGFNGADLDKLTKLKMSGLLN